MRAFIYFIQFLKDDAQSVGGGGIGTLISLMCPLLAEMGYDVTVYQCSGQPFDVRWGDARVVGVPGYPGPGRPNEKVVQSLRQLAQQQVGANERIEIFAGDFFSVKNDNPFSICVQNGLAWDASIDILTPNKIYHNPIGEKIFRYRCQLNGLRRFETCYNRVAVDLYFLNWYRSFRGHDIKGRLFYNPNPAPTAEWDVHREQRDNNQPLRIIFARRLVPEKGTRLIADVFKQLLTLRPDIEITLAGEGPDEGFLRDTFSGDRRVTLTSYKTEDALNVHQAHDIAVIPSLCGEATCLSVLEAMAAGCAVVATNMGGMITEIIDGFNGILCEPTNDALLEGLLKLIDIPEERLRMQKRGWETSQTSFNLIRWQNQWRQIVGTVVNNKVERNQ
jgi:glycosyltransferase involved in cell wall biosynthesis